MTDTFTRGEVLRIARSQLGTTENGFNNDNKYGRWYGMNLQPWCDMFVSWVLDQAGDPDGYRSAYTPAGAAFWKSKERWLEPAELQAGDIAYCDFPGDGVDRISHVLIVERNLGNGTVVTIEGNTSPDTGGSQRDGGGVYRRVRPLSYIVGGGRPSYDGASARMPQPLLREGSTGKTVRELQKGLRTLGYPLTVTGTFDAATAGEVRKFQRSEKLEVDGVVGPATWAALAKALRGVPPRETVKEARDKDAAGEGKARDVVERISRKRALRLVAATAAEVDRLQAEIDAALDELERDLKGSA